MGLFERLFGKGHRAPVTGDHSAVVAVSARLREYHLFSATMMPIVGESHYQQAIRAAVRGRHDDNGGIYVSAEFHLEPSNPHDPNAVRIDVAGRTVGYIARELAVDLGPRLRALSAEGLQPVCHARVFGGGPDKPHYGVWLHATEELLGLQNQPPPDEPVMLRGTSLTNVSGEEDHQDVLAAALPVGLDATYVYVTLDRCVVSTGKYLGQEAIEVRLENRRVGQLTRAMTDRYWSDVGPNLDSGRVVCVQAMLRRESKIEAYLLMPKRTPVG